MKRNSKPKNFKEFLSRADYLKLTRLTPIPCVDAVIMWRGSFLLGKRNDKPAQGKWFLFGGRVLKDERLLDAVKRKVQNEIGVRISDSQIKFLTIGETIFHSDDPAGERHTINTVYLVRLPKSVDMSRFDAAQHSDIQWFRRIDPTWHPYVKMCLREAGFK